MKYLELVMSYHISKFNIPTPYFAHVPEYFTKDEMEQISFLGDLQKFEKGTVGGQNENTFRDVRNSDITWLNHSPNTNWVFDKFGSLVSNVNRDKFLYDIDGIENFQYTTYSEDQFYTWHLDTEMFYKKFVRKISAVIMVSDPEKDFEGGEFEIVQNANITDPLVVNMKQGDVIFFASWMPHRVRPVTKGKRTTLVAWVMGINHG